MSVCPVAIHLQHLWAIAPSHSVAHQLNKTKWNGYCAKVQNYSTPPINSHSDSNPLPRSVCQENGKQIYSSSSANNCPTCIPRQLENSSSPVLLPYSVVVPSIPSPPIHHSSGDVRTLSESCPCPLFSLAAMMDEALSRSIDFRKIHVPGRD